MSDSSSSEEDLSVFQGVAVTAESIHDEAAKAEEARKRSRMAAIRRREGGAGDGESEGGTGGLQLYQVQLGDVLNRRLSRLIDLGTEPETATSTTSSSSGGNPAAGERATGRAKRKSERSGLEQKAVKKRKKKRGIGGKDQTAAGSRIAGAGDSDGSGAAAVRLFRKVPLGTPFLWDARNRRGAQPLQGGAAAVARGATPASSSESDGEASRLAGVVVEGDAILHFAAAATAAAVVNVAQNSNSSSTSDGGGGSHGENNKARGKDGSAFTKAVHKAKVGTGSNAKSTSSRSAGAATESKQGAGNKKKKKKDKKTEEYNDGEKNEKKVMKRKSRANGTRGDEAVRTGSAAMRAQSEEIKRKKKEKS